MEDRQFQSILEAVLFASDRPLGPAEIRAAFSAEGGSASGGEGITIEEIRAALAELKDEYESRNRGLRLVEVAGGYQLATDPRVGPYLKRFYQAREKKRLSQAGLETLSVIAYRQPVTKADIEFIRGVGVDGALKTLLDKGLVRIVGRKDVPGRPMLYGTTKGFLEHFGLNAVGELPPLNQFSEKDIDPNLLPPEMKYNGEPSSEIRNQKTDDRKSVF